MNGWKKSGRGAKARLVGTFDAQEAAVLRGLLDEVRQMLAKREADNPADELAVLTGMRTGPSSRPSDRVLARLLPDFTTEDADLAAGLRSLHEPHHPGLDRRWKPHLHGQGDRPGRQYRAGGLLHLDDRHGRAHGDAWHQASQPVERPDADLRLLG